MKIIVKEVNEKNGNASFLVTGAVLNRWVEDKDGVNGLFELHAPKDSKERTRYACPFHLAKDAEGINGFAAAIKKLMFISAKRQKPHISDDKILQSVNYEFENCKGVYMDDGDQQKLNDKGEPYRNNANSYIIKTYCQASQKRPEVFAKYPAVDGQPIPTGFIFQKTATGGFLKKILTSKDVVSGDTVNIQFQAYIPKKGDGTISFSFTAVQFMSATGWRSNGGQVDYDSFSEFEDSQLEDFSEDDEPTSNDFSEDVPW